MILGISSLHEQVCIKVLANGENKEGFAMAGTVEQISYQNGIQQIFYGDHARQLHLGMRELSDNCAAVGTIWCPPTAIKVQRYSLRTIEDTFRLQGSL